MELIRLDNLAPVPTAPASTTGRKTPVREFLLFPWGQFETTKGVLQFDPGAAALLMAQYQSYTANRDGWLDIDIAHLSQTDDSNPEAHESAGKCKTETRANGQWITELTYLPEVYEKVATEKIKYYSPVVGCDDLNRVVQLSQLGLTNIPAMYIAQPLALSAAPEKKKEPVMKFNALALSALLLAARAKVSDKEMEVDPEAMEAKPHMSEMLGKLGDAIKTAHGDGCKLEEAHEGHVIARMASPNSSDKSYAKIPYTYEGGKVKLGEPAPMKRGFLPAGPKDHAEPDGDEKAMEAMKKLSTRLETTENMLLEATGMRTVSTAIAEIGRLKTSGGADLAAKVLKLEADSVSAKREVLLSRAKKDGKWTAGQEKGWDRVVLMAKRLGDDPILALSDAIESAPVVVAPGREQPPEHEGSGSDGLTQEEHKICLEEAKKFGVDAKVYTQKFLDSKSRLRA